MDDKQVRNFGLVMGGGALAIAAAVANFGEKDTASPAIARAQAQPAPSVEFIVRFKPSHPLAAAQDLSAQGKQDEAEQSARDTLAADAALKGLCFESFTLGGAEVVLSPCDEPAAAQRETVSAQWAGKLRAQPGVEYADANVTVRQEKSAD